MIAKNENGKPELKMSRVFDAPRAMVFEAWTKAEYVQRWFTPAPLTTPKCEVDPRAGGAFRVVMRMPDGTEHPMDGKFVEVVANERIVFASRVGEDLDVMTTVSFVDVGGKTRLDVVQTYSHENPATGGAVAGWTSTLEQLDAFVRSRR